MKLFAVGTVVFCLTFLLIFSKSVLLEDENEAPIGANSGLHFPKSSPPPGPMFSGAVSGCQGDYKYDQATRLEFTRKETREQIGGWMWPDSAYIVALISKTQHDLGICGHVGEIGVYRGLFTIAIAQTMTTQEKMLAADLFNSQEENIDRSGVPEGWDPLELFRRNLVSQKIDPDNDIRILSGNSMRMTPADLTVHKGGGMSQFRLWSVDGGHTAPIASNDLFLVTPTLVDGAVIALDDWCNHQWPGVTEGYYHYLYSHRPDYPYPRVVPFLDHANKLYLTTPNYRQLYFNVIANDPYLKQMLIMEPNRTNIAGHDIYCCANAQPDILPFWQTLLRKPAFEPEKSTQLGEKLAKRDNLAKIRRELANLHKKGEELAEKNEVKKIMGHNETT